MNLQKIKELNIEPYSLQIKHAALLFGYHEKTLYSMVSSGELILGIHYLKVGKKVLIITKGFKKWMHEKSGVIYGRN